MTPYDDDIQNELLTALKVYFNGTMATDEAILYFKYAVQSLYPEISVD